MSRQNVFFDLCVVVTVCCLNRLVPFQEVDAFVAESSLSRLLGNEESPKQTKADLHTAFRQQQHGLAMACTAADSSSDLEVVLFGAGDLRTDDHGGLYQALLSADERSKRQILPLVILDDASLTNIPGAVAHTVDTASMLVAALSDLQQGLQEKLGLDLQIVQLTSAGETLSESLVQLIKQHTNNGNTARVHVCNLGDTDLYGPFGSLNANFLPENIKILPWVNHLRENPWKKVESLPEKYPDFVSQYTGSETPPHPISLNSSIFQNRFESVKLSGKGGFDVGIPTSEDLVNRMQKVLDLDPAVVQAEKNTGMYETHWGGLDPTTVGESQVLKRVETFVHECQEEDSSWVRHPLNADRGCPRNGRSLEHSTYAWMLRGTGAQPFGVTHNLLAGEPMTRYLGAPLMLGTISSRRLWHLSKRERPFFASPLRTLVEGQEWHKLLAAKNLRTKKEYQQGNDEEASSPGQIKYGYWRWQGYLCRYAQTQLADGSQSGTAEKEGVLFIHGFGASGSQWSKTMHELSKCLEPDSQPMEGLAPDLLGFGQCEKPPISYSIYVWDAQVTDFIKEIAVKKHKWNSYIVGGNSIGGFGAASTAANEMARVDERSVCSNGSPGTGMCKGVVLMNPAGPIQSREQVEEITAAAEGEPTRLLTVAQVTAMDALPPCKPLARPVARVFGNGLLAYLRPRIRSICVNLYPTNPSAVDDELCTAIERDSLDPGAINVMISGAKLPPPRSMNEMLQADYGALSPETLKRSVSEVSFGGPVLVATGVLDPLNDAKGRSEGLKVLRDGIDFDPINAGHCPHDELPADVSAAIAKWMKAKVRSAAGSLAASKAVPAAYGASSPSGGPTLCK
jgi:pimeloyl-ACP methyl ester carboxylesterase